MSAEQMHVPEKSIDVIEPGQRARKGHVALDLARDLSFSAEALRSYAFARWEPIICDAMVLAATVEFSDRIVKRPRLAWARRFSLRVPVHELARWQSPEVRSALHEALSFLTGDFWNIEFVKRKSRAPAPPQEFLHLRVPTRAVLAYSDGMDSRAVAGLLGNTLGDQLIRVRVGSKRWDRLPGNSQAFTAVPYDVPCNMPNREASSRSRGFRFALISGIAAYLTDAQEIVIPESGQGAIGPALVTVGHVYPDYRNHPLFTIRMERLLTVLFGHSVRYVFPRIWSTKGETLGEFALVSGAEWTSTRSCWRNNQWSSVNGRLRQCGVCAACMLRRLSVHAAGLLELPDTYVCTDISAPTLAQALDPSFTRFNRAFEEYAIAGVLHMDHMAAMAGADATKLIRRHGLLLGPALGLEPNAVTARLVALFTRHAREWAAFLSTAGTSSFLQKWAHSAP